MYCENWDMYSFWDMNMKISETIDELFETPVTYPIVSHGTKGFVYESMNG